MLLQMTFFILSYGWVIFHCMYMCVCMYVRVCICMYVYIYHIFFIHSSVDGHLICFHVLFIVNSAAINTGVHVRTGFLSPSSPHWSLLPALSETSFVPVCSLEQKHITGLLPIFWLGCLFFWYWAVWDVSIFWKLSPCWSHGLQIFSASP